MFIDLFRYNAVSLKKNVFLYIQVRMNFARLVYLRFDRTESKGKFWLVNVIKVFINICLFFINLLHYLCISLLKGQNIYMQNPFQTCYHFWIYMVYIFGKKKNTIHLIIWKLKKLTYLKKDGKLKENIPFWDCFCITSNENKKQIKKKTKKTKNPENNNILTCANQMFGVLSLSVHMKLSLTEILLVAYFRPNFRDFVSGLEWEYFGVSIRLLQISWNIAKVYI